MGCSFTNTEWYSCYMFIYTSYNRTHIENAYIYIYILTQSWTGTKVFTSSNPQFSAPVPRPGVNGMERMWQRHGSDQMSFWQFTHNRLYLVIIFANTISHINHIIDKRKQIIWNARNALDVTFKFVNGCRVYSARIRNCLIFSRCQYRCFKHIEHEIIK